MSKQLNVNLAFTADTSQAKAALQQLQQQLTKVINTSSTNTKLGINEDLNKAISATAELQAHLQKAVNVKTGNLDFSKLNESLSKSGKTLSQYGDELRKLGPEGYQAFQQLAQSITMAEIPLKRSNALMSELWTTMKNTARWQLTSSMLHGFMGALQTAYGYAQDLNESLNNIRIVTGQNIDQMSRFAQEANKAAKALSTSTTEYTNASLIYYQQGLTDQQVKERTDITIKMANVSRQSAEEVSDQMTAVWNNFYDGSQSLEHYADAMTKLGADTASSSDEIAQGLEKFAAIGDTIGLSFDNAAAALATVTATTRQSADVVGTAFKTIFARIQGLNLGETLDDGTTLNKYSEALSKVGISIFESSGNLKDMDNILAEMGEKWKGLNEDQKTALAQTVAGVRQYTQLIALMENFDFYEKNLASAQNADGTLQAQADIYAESWEAAQKRVRAAAENIYSDLINDEAFIDILNIIEKLLTGFDNLIENMGGLGGVLTSLGTIITKVFHNQLSQGLTNAAYNLKMLTKKGREAVEAERQATLNKFSKATENEHFATEAENVANKSLQRELKLQQSLLEKADQMTDIELERNKILIERQRILAEESKKSAINLEESKNQLNDIESKMNQSIFKNKDNTEYQKANWNKLRNNKANIKASINFTNEINYDDLKNKTVSEKKQELTKLIKDSGFIDRKSKSLTTFIHNIEDSEFEGKNFEKTFSKILGKVSMEVDEAKAKILDLKDASNKPLIKEEVIDEYIASANEVSEKAVDHKKVLDAEAEGFENVQESINDSTGAQQQWADHLVNISNSILSVISIIQILGSTVDTLSDPDATGWEKFSAVLTAVATIIPMVSMALDKNTIASYKAAGSAVLTALGFNTEAFAAVKAAKGTAAFSAALWSALWPIALVVAAIAGLTVIITKLIANYKQLETENKQAAEDLNNTKQAFDDVNNSISETQSLLDGLGDKYSNIQELEYGTSKWRDAVSNLNNDLTDTLEKYDLLSDASNWYRDSQGVMHLTDQGVEALQKAMDEQQQAMDVALTAAENRKRKTQLALDAQTISRKYEYKATTDIQALGAFSKGSSLTEEEIQKLIEAQLKDTSFDLTNEQELQLLGFDEGAIKLITSNEKLREEIIKLTNATKDASEAYEVDVANDLIAAGLNLDSIAEEYRSGILSQISQDTLGKKDIYKDVILSDEGLIGGKDADQWIQEYLDYHGYSGNAREDGVKDWFNSNDTLTTFKQDENGNRTEEKITIDKDSIAEWAALMQAEAETLNMNLEQYQALITRSEEAWDAADNLNKETSNLKEILDTFENVKGMGFTQLKEDDVLKSNYEADVFEKNKQDFADLVGLDVNSNILKETFGDADWVLNNLEDIQDALNGDAEALNRLRQEVRNTNNDIQETSKSWYDNSEAAQIYFNELAKGEGVSKNTLKNLQQSLADNTDELSAMIKISPKIFKSFIKDAAQAEKVAQAFKKASEGNIKPLQDLRAELAEEYLLTLKIDATKIKEVQTYHDTIAEILKDPIQANIDLNSEDFLNTCNQLIKAAGMTAEEAQKYFASMGYNAEVESTTVTPEPTTTTMEWLEYTKTIGGIPQFEKKVETLETQSSPITVPTIKSITADGSSFGGDFNIIEKSKSVDAPDTGNGNSQGGGDDYTPEIDRNHEIKRVISDLEDSYNRLAAAKDRAYGANHINLIDKEISQTNELIEAQQALLAEHEMYLAQDKAKVLALFPHAQFDDQGNISNYNALRMQTTSEEQVEILDQYEETLDEIKETREAIRDLQYQIQDLNFEKLQYELEYKVEISDDALKKLDYFANKFSNNVYQSVESLVINYEEGEEYSNILELNKDFVSKLDENFEQNKISQADYIEGLRQAREATLEQLNNLLALDEEMQVFYGETLESTNEELEKYTSRLEHTSDVLDHYLNLVDLLGKSKDYELIGDLQEKKVQSALNLFEISKSNYETLAKEKEALQASLDEAKSKVDQNKVQNLEKQLDEAKTSLDNTKKKITELENLEEVEDEEAHQKEIEELKTQKEKLAQDILDFSSQIAEEKAPVDFLKSQLDDITEAYEMSYEEMLDALTEYLETYKEKVETTFDSISATLEKSLTGGVGFDRMLDDFEMLDRQQEEFLTKTNQIYETNKLIRTANQEIEKIDNEIAKKKLRSYVEETKNLQNNNKLSKYELDVQQAKYDLLLAEIALEEARNAKSQVSLVRDSEGNFGYAYTADQDEISKAEQAYEDAQNKLYNISYDGQQEYTEKFLSALQEYSEKQNQMAKDYLDGEYENREAFNEDLARLEEQYRGDNGILTIYSDLADMASKVDINALIENHRGKYLNKALGLESFDEAFAEANEDISKTVDDLDNTLTEVETMMQTTLTSSDQLIENSNKLTEEVKNEVIPELANERKEVIELTKEYSNLRQELLEYIRDFEGLLFGANGIDDKIKKQSENVENKESILTYEGRTISIPGIPTTLPKEEPSPSFTGNYDIDHEGSTLDWSDDGTFAYEHLGWDDSSQTDIKNEAKDNKWRQSSSSEDMGNISKTSDHNDSWNPRAQKTTQQTTKNQLNQEKAKIEQAIANSNPGSIGNEILRQQLRDINKQIASLNTGGYTGEWGPEGKLGILHQKELVLKPSDTENILSAVSIIRDISNAIDRYASISRAIGLSLAPNIHTTESTVEQNVKIEATFPNVSNHSEIEEAFNNLVNEAAQYAYRKK